MQRKVKFNKVFFFISLSLLILLSFSLSIFPKELSASLGLMSRFYQLNQLKRAHTNYIKYPPSYREIEASYNNWWGKNSRYLKLGAGIDIKCGFYKREDGDEALSSLEATGKINKKFSLAKVYGRTKFHQNSTKSKLKLSILNNVTHRISKSGDYDWFYKESVASGSIQLHKYVKLYLSATVTAGVKADTTSFSFRNERPSFESINFIPYTESYINGEVVLSLKVVEAGVSGTITLIDEKLDMRIDGYYSENRSNTCCPRLAKYVLKVRNKVNTLSGNIKAFAKIKIWGPFKYTKRWKIFDWNGYKKNEQLINKSVTYCPA